ncbi:MAG: hypothetical protein K0R10_2717 [Alphaproteobacteria bacterium]|jgi:uncharacterized protein (DUF488 family)|nr:hypothetical protein [Alphaproteobacteria bacterium]
MAKKKILYTIGYEGVTVDALMRRLASAGVKTLIDVRAVPLSRKPGFSKNRLAAHLAEYGIVYAGLKGLGTPAAGRDAARKGRIAEMRRIFEGHMDTELAQADLEKAMQIAGEAPACLLCFEHQANCCHRLIVAEIMAEKSGMDIRNLDPVNEA